MGRMFGLDHPYIHPQVLFPVQGCLSIDSADHWVSAYDNIYRGVSRFYIRTYE